MWKDALRDPRVRRAYVLTKLSVFAGAAALTWPLSRVVGPKAWIGLGVFAVVLLALTATVLAASGAAGQDDGGEAEEDDESEDPGTEAPVVIPIEDCLDLHPFQPAEVPEVVADYLEQAVTRGMSEVRLIHGRGIGVQRERVRSLLSRHPLVVSYADAPPQRGGWGATIARLDISG